MLSVYATMRDPSLAAGACRFLLKDSGRDELVGAIRWRPWAMPDETIILR